MSPAGPAEHSFTRGTPPGPRWPGPPRWPAGPHDSVTAARAAGPGEHSATPGDAPGPPRALEPPDGPRHRSSVMRPGPGAGSAYESAGVSIEAGDRAVALMRDAV